MSLGPDLIKCEYSIDHPVQNEYFACEFFGCNGEIFTITREGQLVGPRTSYHDQDGKFNLTGSLEFHTYSKSGELFFYIANFFKGKILSITRPDLIEFESKPNKKINPWSAIYTHQLGPNNGTIYRITREGRLHKIDSSGTKDTNFHGYLIYYPDACAARFDRGQLQSVELNVRKSIDQMRLLSQRWVLTRIETASKKQPATKQVATCQSGKNLHPLPAYRKQLSISRVFSAAEYEKIVLGFIPQSFDDEWFIFFEENKLNIHKSWTGYCLYQLEFEPHGNEFAVKSGWINCNPSENTATDEEWEIMFIYHLIDSLLLNKTELLMNHYELLLDDSKYQKPYFEFDFEEGIIKGFGGCSLISGTLQEKDGFIRFVDIKEDEKNCPETERRILQEVFISKLKSINGYEVGGGRLELFWAHRLDLTFDGTEKAFPNPSKKVSSQIHNPKPEFGTDAAYDALDTLVTNLGFPSWKCLRTGDEFYLWNHPIHQDETMIKMTDGNSPFFHYAPFVATIEWDNSNLLLIKQTEKSGKLIKSWKFPITDRLMEKLKSLSWASLVPLIIFLNTRVVRHAYTCDSFPHETTGHIADCSAILIDFFFPPGAYLKTRVKTQIEFLDPETDSVKLTTKPLWGNKRKHVLEYKDNDDFVEFKPGNEYSLAVFPVLGLIYQKESGIRIDHLYLIKISITIDCDGFLSLHTFRFKLSYNPQKTLFEKIDD